MRKCLSSVVKSACIAATQQPNHQEVAVNKADLIDKVAAHAGLTKRDAEAALDAVTHSITIALRSGDPVRIIGFGSFRLRERGARTGRNPQTGASVKIKASKGAAFTAGATLKRDLNSRSAPAAPAKATAAKAPAKAAATKTVAKKAPAKKAVAKKAPAKKAVAKKAPAKKAVVKKAPAKKAPAKKAPAKKAVKKATKSAKKR
jgi:DNA-binding protein HU-beta